LLTGIAELLETGGIIPRSTVAASGESPRKKGLKLGLFIFLLTFLVVPITAIISMAIGIEPWAVAIAATLFVVGGLLRMLYAAFFESAIPLGGDPATLEAQRPAFLNRPPTHALPPQQSVPVTAYAPPAGNWRETNDLEPRSVTEHTTRLLEKEEGQ